LACGFTDEYQYYVVLVDFGGVAHAGYCHTHAGTGVDQVALEGYQSQFGRSVMIEIEEGSGNVYADLQTPEAEAKHIKAHLASLNSFRVNQIRL